MVAEGSVVGVLLDGHELNHVVATFLNAVEIVVGEVTVGANTTKFLGHTDMCLVNSHALLWLSNGSLVSPLELFLRIPPEAIIQKGRWVLNSHAGPSRVSVSPFSIWSFNIDLVLGAVRNSWFSIDSRDRDVEASKVILSCPKFFPIPLVEFSENRNRISTWCPLLVDDVAIWLNVETILLVRSSDIDETALGIFKNLKPSKKIEQS